MDKLFCFIAMSAFIILSVSSQPVTDIPEDTTTELPEDLEEAETLGLLQSKGMRRINEKFSRYRGLRRKNPLCDPYGYSGTGYGIGSINAPCIPASYFENAHKLKSLCRGFYNV